MQITLSMQNVKKLHFNFTLYRFSDILVGNNINIFFSFT